MRGIALGLLAAITALLPATARGQETPTAVLVSLADCCPQSAWSEAEQATADELKALAFEVVTTPLPPDSTQKPLEEIAAGASPSAICAVRLTREDDGGGSVEIWMLDSRTQETTLRTLPLAETNGPEEAAVAALRITEAVRVGLFGPPAYVPEEPGRDDETPEPSPTREPEPAEEAETAPDIAATTSLFGIGIGAGVAGSPGGVGTRGAVHLAIVSDPLPHLSLEIDAYVTILGRDVEEQDASSTFDVALVRGAAYWEILDSGPVRPSLGIAGGAVFSWATGVRADRSRLRTDRATSAYLGGAGRLGFPLMRHLWLRLSFRAGGLFPEVQLVFTEERQASFGRPLIDGLVDLEVRFP